MNTSILWKWASLTGGRKFLIVAGMVLGLPLHATCASWQDLPWVNFGEYNARIICTENVDLSGEDILYDNRVGSLYLADQNQTPVVGIDPTYLLTIARGAVMELTVQPSWTIVSSDVEWYGPPAYACMVPACTADWWRQDFVFNDTALKRGLDNYEHRRAVWAEIILLAALQPDISEDYTEQMRRIEAIQKPLEIAGTAIDLTAMVLEGRGNFVLGDFTQTTLKNYDDWLRITKNAPLADALAQIGSVLSIVSQDVETTGEAVRKLYLQALATSEAEIRLRAIQRSLHSIQGIDPAALDACGDAAVNFAELKEQLYTSLQQAFADSIKEGIIDWGELCVQIASNFASKSMQKMLLPYFLSYQTWGFFVDQVYLSQRCALMATLHSYLVTGEAIIVNDLLTENPLTQTDVEDAIAMRDTQTYCAWYFYDSLKNMMSGNFYGDVRAWLDRSYAEYVTYIGEQKNFCAMLHQQRRFPGISDLERPKLLVLIRPLTEITGVITGAPLPPEQAEIAYQILGDRAGYYTARIQIDSQSPISVTFESGSHIFEDISEGSHSVKLWIENRTGNQIDGTLSTDSFTMDDIPVPSPVGLVAHPGDSRVDLFWIAPNVGEQGFNVWRTNCSGGPYTKLNGTLVTDSTYIDTSVTNDQIYFYIVRTVQGGNESANSNEVSATPVAQDRQGPIISNIRHEPQSATASDTINIFADITDTSGIGGARVHWWKQGTVVPTEMGWIQMSRIGTSNTWRTGEPIPVWPAGTIINYEISGYDGNRYVSKSAVYSYTVGAVVDSQGPTLFGMYPAPGSTIYSARPTIECRMVDNGGAGDVDESRIIIKVDSVNVSASAHRNDDEVTYKPATNLADGLHTVWVSIPDMSHNVSTYQWQFTVDTTPQIGNLIEHLDTIVPTYGHNVDSFDIWQDYVAWVDKTEHRVRLYSLKTQQEIWQSPASHVPGWAPIRLNDGKLVYIDTAPNPDKFYVYDIISGTLTNVVWTYDNSPMNPDISGKYLTFESLNAAHDSYYVWVKDMGSGHIYQGPEDGMSPRIEGTKVIYMTSPMSGEDIHLWDFISGSDTVICSQSGDQEGPAIANGLCVFENQNTSPDHFALTTLSGSGYQQLSVGRSVGYPDIDDRYAVWVEYGTTSTGTCDNVWIYDYVSGQKYQLTAGIAYVDGPSVSGSRVAYYAKSGVDRLIVAELATEAVWPQAKVFGVGDAVYVYGLATDESGSIYVSARRNSDDKVVKYDRNGNFQFDFGTESKIENPKGLDTKGGAVYVCSGQLDCLVKYSDLGVYCGKSPGILNSPKDVAIRSDGHLFAINNSYVRHYDANMVQVEDISKSMLGIGSGELKSCAITANGKLVVMTDLVTNRKGLSLWDSLNGRLLDTIALVDHGDWVATWRDRFVYVTDSQGISVFDVSNDRLTMLIDGQDNDMWDAGDLAEKSGLAYQWFKNLDYIDMGPMGEVYYYNDYLDWTGIVRLPPFFYCDMSAPAITVLSPADGTRTASGILQFQITDNLVGVDEAATRVYLDDQDISSMFVQQGGIYAAELVAGSHPLMNGNHVLKIRAADYAGNTQITNVAFTIDAKPPAPVTSLTAFDTGTGGSIQLDWTSYVETNETDLAGYYVFASPSPISVTNGLQHINPALIPVGTRTYQATGLTNGVAYYFAVTPVDTLGNVAEIVVNAGPVAPHAQPLPDLYVSPSDVIFEPSLLTQGIISDIVITIHNCGLAAANSFGLAVYVGDPNQGGIRIDDGTTSLNAAAGGTATVRISYMPVNIGWEQLYVILDPSNTIQEQNKANNSTVIGGYVSAPIAPAGDFDGNSWEDLADFAIFASAWMSQPGQPNWNPACDISSPKDDIIDWSDFAIFVEYWLTGIEYSLPTISAGDFDGNGQEDLMDFAILASAWMSQPGEINWNQSCDISEPKDSIVDWSDLTVFVTDWLLGVK